MSKDKKFNIYFIIISITIFTISVIRSIKIGITYDEALTYLNFVLKPKTGAIDFMANNHLLNTYLIKFLTIITGIKYNEFLIRIPSLIFYIIYIIYTYKLSCLYKNKYYIASILLFNYSINEFSSLARGYMIASSIVLTGIFYYKKWLLENKNKDLKKALFLLLFSGFANTITLIIFGCFTIDAIIKNIKTKNFISLIKKNKIFVLILVLLSIILLSYHIYIYNNDNYISYCDDTFFNCFIYTQIKYYGIEVNSKLIIYFIFLSVLLILLNFKDFNQNNDLYHTTIILFFFFLIWKFILPFGFPNGRTLIPFYSIYIIGLIDFFESFNKNKIINILIFIITIICIFSFFKNINTNYVREWKDDSEIKDLAKNLYINKNYTSLTNVKSNQTIATIFYNEKYKYLYKYKIIR